MGSAHSPTAPSEGVSGGQAERTFATFSDSLVFHSHNPLTESDRRLLEDLINERRQKPCKRIGNHIPNGEYVCTYNCGYMTDRKDSWLRHEECRQPQRFWICSQCRTDAVEKRFVAIRKDKLREHCKAKHNIRGTEQLKTLLAASPAENPGIFEKKCPYGTYRFKSWDDRTAHLTLHFKDKSMKCDNNDSPDSIVSGGLRTPSSDPTMPKEHIGNQSRSFGRGAGSSHGSEGNAALQGHRHAATSSGHVWHNAGQGVIGSLDHDVFFTTYDFSLDLFDGAFKPEPSFFDALKLVGLLGHGAHAQVEEVRHDRTDRTFARKRFHNSQFSSLQNFFREVQIMRRLRHPSIVRFVAAYRHNSHSSIVMEPVAEYDLATFLADQGKANEIRKSILPWFIALNSGVAYLHSQHICHGDIKLSNILLLGSEVFFTDFGAARDAFTSHETEIALVNTAMPGYSAPNKDETLFHGHKADLFSLGFVLLQLVAGSLGRTLIFAQREQNVDNARGLLSKGSQNRSWMETTIEDLKIQADSLLGRLLEVCQTLLRISPAERPSACDLEATLGNIAEPLAHCPSKLGVRPTRREASLVNSDNKESADTKLDTARRHAEVCDQLHGWTFTFRFRKNPLLMDGVQDLVPRRRPAMITVSKNLRTYCAAAFPLRLIDLGGREEEVSLCDSSKILSTGGPVAYAVIDHCWVLQSSVTVDSVPRPGCLDNWIRLPRTFHQAVAVVRRMEFRYIWVKSICILEDECYHKASLKSERAAFENACMTIVVATGLRNSAPYCHHDIRSLPPVTYTGDPDLTLSNQDIPNAVVPSGIHPTNEPSPRMWRFEYHGHRSMRYLHAHYPDPKADPSQLHDKPSWYRSQKTIGPQSIRLILSALGSSSKVKLNTFPTATHTNKSLDSHRRRNG